MAECRCNKRYTFWTSPGKDYKVCLKCGQYWMIVRGWTYHARTTQAGARREIGFYARGGWSNNVMPYRLKQYQRSIDLHRFYRVKYYIGVCKSQTSIPKRKLHQRLMWLTPPFRIIGDNMATNNLKIKNDIIRRVVAIHLYRKAGMVTQADYDAIYRNTELRKHYYLLGDGIATDLWIAMKNMGGSVRG